MSLATLLSNPGTVSPAVDIAVDTGVLLSSPSELTLGSGVWTAR